MDIFQKMNATDTTGHSLSTDSSCLRNALQFTRSLLLLILSVGLLYVGIYLRIKRVPKLDVIFMISAIASFCVTPWLAPIDAGPAYICTRNHIVFAGVLKTLDILARRNALPKYTASPVQPPPWLLAGLLLTEFRYESFTPNRIRVSRRGERFSEPWQLALHTAAFVLLQYLPQNIPAVVAFGVLLFLYIEMTAWQLLTRYKNSPALFGPLYLADSLTGFWSNTWHNIYAAICESLAYRPARDILPRYGVPVAVARSVGIFAAFALMAAYHVYILYPVLPSHGLFRIGMFFVINGVATICEAAIWGRRRHWLKTIMAWTFETYLASWVVAGVGVPNGVRNIPWRAGYCGPIQRHEGNWGYRLIRLVLSLSNYDNANEL